MDAAWNSVLVGLPVLLMHLAVTAGLLVGGVGVYVSLAPYRELELIREGNTAAAVVLAGQTAALGIPLAAMLANSVSVPDIVLWGMIALALQFVAVGITRLLIHRLCGHIARGEIGPALVLATGQIMAGVLTAAAISG
jgi:putative membrane protein